MVKKAGAVIAAAWAAIGASGCDGMQSARDAANLQNGRDAAAKFADLAPAEGTFEGTAHFEKEDLDLALEVTVKRVWENQPDDSPSPAEIVQVPRLKGSLSLPAFRDASPLDWDATELLTSAMAGFAVAWIDRGDYDSSTGNLNLPYSLPNVNGGDFGELQLKPGDGKPASWQGVWFSKPAGEVATVTLASRRKEVAP